MKNKVIIVLFLIIILLFGFLSQPFIAAANATVPDYKCQGKYTNLKLSYFDKVQLISQFKSDKNFKKAKAELSNEGVKLLLFSPYMRKVKTNDGRIIEEIWYKSTKTNSNKTVILIGIKNINSPNTQFNVQISEAKQTGSKEWIVNNKYINTDTEVTFSIKNGTISIKDYTPSINWGCIACMGACEGACWALDVVCIIPCIALCHEVCSGPCGGS